MNINVSIVDQRVNKIMEAISETVRETLNINDEIRLKSLSFVYLCVQTILELSPEDTLECLTEGGGDFGIDAIHMSEEVDGEFEVTIFQGKYKKSLDGNSNFEENGIIKLVNAVKYIFDPNSQIKYINNRLVTYIEEARSRVSDGMIPRVRVVACNNGLKWNTASQEHINRANFGSQVTWEHVNHDTIISIMQRIKPVEAILKLCGAAIVEDMNYSRVCIGRIPVTEVAELMRQYGEILLDRNIRRYLGLRGNRVNEGIKSTLCSLHPENFYFFNNGLTLVCTDFTYNALQKENYCVKVENLQIVNGGQTCMTIFKTLEGIQNDGGKLPINASVLIRLYKLPKDNEDIALQITHATNSQNPVDLKDLRSNDEIQLRLEMDIKQLGYVYRRKRADTAIKPTDITTGTAAEAVLSIWRNAPHQARFFSREHFGKLYDIIFSSALNGSQVVIAVLLYRIAENHRKRPLNTDPVCVRYAGCFIAMQMGRRLLKDLKITLEELNHTVFNEAKELIEKRGEQYFQKSHKDIDDALKKLYGEQNISMQQLSATFRRGDLISRLLAEKI